MPLIGRNTVLPRWDPPEDPQRSSWHKLRRVALPPAFSSVTKVSKELRLLITVTVRKQL